MVTINVDRNGYNKDDLMYDNDNSNNDDDDSFWLNYWCINHMAMIVKIVIVREYNKRRYCRCWVHTWVTDYDDW